MTEKNPPKAAVLVGKSKVRRRHERITATVRVIVKLGPSFVPMITKDINPGGLFLLTDNPQANLEIVHLKVDMGRGHPPLTTAAIVKHSVSSSMAKKINSEAGMGVQFYGLSGIDQKRWNLFVMYHEQQNEKRRLTEQPPRTQAGLLPPRGRHSQEDSSGAPYSTGQTQSLAERNGQQPQFTEIGTDQRSRVGREPTGVRSFADELRQRVPTKPHIIVPGKLAIPEPNEPLPSIRQPPTKPKIQVPGAPMGGRASMFGSSSAEARPSTRPTISAPSSTPNMVAPPPLAPREVAGRSQEGRAVEAGQIQHQHGPELTMNSAESSDFMAMNGKGFSGLWPLLEQPRQSYAGEFHLPFENMEQLESFIEIDVSRGHTLIPTYEPADVGGLILIQLVHPLTEELFPISGQVIEIREWDQELLGMLTRFVGLTDKHRDGLKKFISYGFNVL